MPLQLIDLSLRSPEENLALDEALLADAEAAAASGRDLGYLRLWESPDHFVVLGSACSLEKDVWVDRCRQDAIPILRRASGGGTVLQGPGCLNFSLALPLAHAPGLREIHSSYRAILGPSAAALGIDGIALRGSCDLALGEKKFSGSAQKRKRHCLLHQATLLYDFDLELMPRYLRRPEKQPNYREGREHVDFVMNLPLDAASLRARIASAWDALPPGQAWKPPTLDGLLESKYRNRKWIERF